jgi:TatD DNase family protein
MLIDTHAHLSDDRLRPNLAAVLARADAAGVKHVVCVATGAADAAASINIARQFQSVSASAGIHPNHAVEAKDGDWNTVVRLAADPAVVAIGETGLDRHWDFTPFAMQEDYFARHLQLSRHVNKPIVIHCREAEADVVRMLRVDFDAHGPIRGVLHSFCGSQATADAALAMGLFISFAGMLTYKTADNVRAVAARRDGLSVSRAGAASWQDQRAGICREHRDQIGRDSRCDTGSARRHNHCQRRATVSIRLKICGLITICRPI